MVRTLRRVVSIACAPAFLCSCEQKGNDWPVTPVPEYSYADLNKQLPAYLCDRLMRCPSAKDDQLIPRALFQTADRCAEVVGQALRRRSRNFDPTEAIGSGRIVFDAGKAHAYLDGLAGPCDGTASSLDPARGGALRGTVEAGDSCAVSVECTDGSYCAHANGACPGVCAKKKAAGEQCTSNLECASHYCDASGACEALKVAAAAAEGEACGLQTNPSATRTPCAGDLWCQGTPMGVCRRELPIDSPCTGQDDICVLGSLCLTDVDGTKRCRPVNVVGEGQLCTGESGPDVRLCDTFSFLSCNQGKCTAPTATNEGASCVRTDFVDGCDPGLYCASQSNVCLQSKKAGDACSSTEECASGYCISGSGTCSATFCD